LGQGGAIASTNAKNQTILILKLFKLGALKKKIGWLFDHLIRVGEVVGSQNTCSKKVSVLNCRRGQGEHTHSLKHAVYNNFTLDLV
jgi:hypothetical protein